MRSEFKKRLASFKKRADGRVRGSDIVYALILSAKDSEEVIETTQELVEWLRLSYTIMTQIAEKGFSLEATSWVIDSTIRMSDTIESKIKMWEKSGEDMNKGWPLLGDDKPPQNVRDFLKRTKENFVKDWNDNFKRYENELQQQLPKKDFSLLQSVMFNFLLKHDNEQLKASAEQMNSPEHSKWSDPRNTPSRKHISFWDLMGEARQELLPMLREAGYTESRISGWEGGNFWELEDLLERLGYQRTTDHPIQGARFTLYKKIPGEVDRMSQLPDITRFVTLNALNRVVIKFKKEF